MKNIDFKSYIRDIQDFPKEGVVFKDITPLLKNGEALNLTVDALIELLDDQKLTRWWVWKVGDSFLPHCSLVN